MLNNVGAKIKKFAKTIFVIEAVLVIIGAFCMLLDSLIVEGIVVIAVGLLTTVVSSLLIYGVGEIIEKLCQIEENTRNNIWKKDRIFSAREEQLQGLLEDGLITQTEYQQAMSK